MYYGSSHQYGRSLCILRRHIVSSYAWRMTHTFSAGTIYCKHRVQAQVAQYLSFAGVSAQGEQSVMGGEASSSMEHSLYVLYSVSALTGYANRVMGKQEFGYARTP